MNVVPYNPYTLPLWDAHVCAMKITSKCLDCYLVNYIAKEEPTFGLHIVEQDEVQWYLETRVIGAPEATAIQASNAICNSNMGVIYVDTNMPNDKVQILKPQDIVAEDNKESEEIYEPSGSVYISQYNHTWHMNVLKYTQDMMVEDLDNKVVYMRRAVLILQTHFLTALDGDELYYWQLLLKMSFRYDTKLLCDGNVIKIYKEECYIQGLFN